jgi:hypothetical protein
MTRFENVGLFIREKVWLENSPEPTGSRVIGQWLVRVQKLAVEGNEPQEGHGRVCEGDKARVGVGHGMVEVKLFIPTRL